MNTKNRIKTILTLAAVAMPILFLATTSANADATALTAALTALEDHITGVAPLSGSQIEAHKLTIDANKNRFDDSSAIITVCFGLVETYDNVIGPMFVSGSSVQSFSRSSTSNTDINWAVYNVMQYIIDYSFTTGTIASYPTLIDGFKFGSSAFFPGAVNPPADPDATYTVTVDGSYLNTFGHDVMHQERAARKPTGAYLAPGSIATVTVPSKIAGKGYQVRIGANSWDFSNKPTIKRPDRSTIVYNINSTEVKVASPLGGGIYIEVPQYSYEGLVEVQIKNAVRSPYFSKKSFHTTTLSQWQNTERHHPGPWADFQSEKFMMQVPTDWIYNFDDPVTLMDKWDTAMDALDELMGFPQGSGKETMYMQPDLFFRSGAHAPGYPSVNYRYNPNSNYGGNVNNYFVKGPEYVPSAVFHEAGHGYLFVKFSGEQESNVNLQHVAVWHRYFGFDLDYAFAASRGYQGNPNRTLDNTAVAWMTSFNFSPREVPMHQLEKQYQLKGHAKFVDIVRLFGWEGLDAFWYSINDDYENGKYWSRHGSNYNDLILRWCQSVGVDLRPLFHFWGIHPANANTLKTRVEAEGLEPSPEIYNLLIKYKSLVPADNAAFQTFALNWWGHEPSINGYWTETEHARQWDTQIRREQDANDQQRPNGEIYTEDSAAEIRAVIDGLLVLYFSLIDAGDDMITWSGQAVELDATVETAGTYTWSADPDTGVLFSATDVEDPTVTITKAAGDAITVTLTLVFDDGLTVPVQDTMTIDVYDDACKATLGAGKRADNPTDIAGDDCITNLEDFAVMAAKWLNDTGLTAPVPK